MNGGASFAKKAADMLRAHFPRAIYIGYEDDVQQTYGDYCPDDEKEQLRKLWAGEDPRLERRKLGKRTGKRAKELQIHL